MKQKFLFSIALLAAGSVLADDSAATIQLGNAIAKLKAAPNFSWTMTLKIPALQFEPGVLKGRAEKDGYAVASQELGDWTLDAVFKGDRVALKTDGEWRLPDPSDGRATMIAGLLTRYGTAANEAGNLLKNAAKLELGEGDVVTGELTEQGAKDALTFRPRGGDGPPPPKNAKGSVKFWLKDGALSKFESRVQGTVAFGQDDEERELSVTRTIEIQDVGTTKVDAPAQARQKIESKEQSNPVKPGN